MTDPLRAFVRHIVATLAYRGGKTLAGAPEDFAAFNPRPGTRTLAMLRRMAGAPVRGENYFRADIVAGRVGPEQSARRVEFD